MESAGVQSDLLSNPAHVDKPNTDMSKNRTREEDEKAEQSEKLEDLDHNETATSPAPQAGDLASRSKSYERPSLHPVRTHNSDSDSYFQRTESIVDEDIEKDAQPSEKSFEVHWDGDSDPDSPKSLSKARKWVIVIIVSLCSLCVTCASSLYSSTYEQLMKEFHCSEEVATLGLTLFVLGLAFGPMLLGPLSEFYGRRPIYLASISFSLIWLIPCAAAQNIQTMILGRFLGGFAGSAFLAVAGGSIVDLFNRSEIQFPMVVFTVTPFLGPIMGPVIGGFICQFTSWRWCFYVLIIWTALILCLIVFFVPETFSKVLLRKKAQKLRISTGNDQWYAPIEKMNRSITQTVMRSCYTPFQLLLLEPMCLSLDLFSAILLGVLYLFFGAFALVFKNNHGFNQWQVGMSFLGLGIGIVLAACTDPLWHKNYARLVRQREAAGGEPGGTEPEYRLPPAIAGAVLVPIGLFWFGWTTYSSVHWIVPIIGSAFFGAGMFLVFAGIFTFLVDAYPSYAASALASNVFIRAVFAAAFPLFGNQMYNKLGYQWATSLLAFLTVAMLPFPFLFFKYGKRIRGLSKFAT